MLKIPTKSKLLLEKFLREYYDFTKETISGEKFSNFRFGIELEGYFDVFRVVDLDTSEFENEFIAGKDSDKSDVFLKILTKVNYLIRDKFGIKRFFSRIYRDISLWFNYDDRHYPLEFVTRVLTLEEFKMSIPVMKYIIETMDVTFDENCGFHISFSNPELPNNPDEINWLKVYILSGLYEAGKKYKRIGNSYAFEIIGAINTNLILGWNNDYIEELSKKYPKSQRVLIKFLAIVFKLFKGENIDFRESKFLADRSSIFFKKEMIMDKYNAINLRDYKSKKKRIEIRLFGNNAPNDFENVVNQTINVALATYFIYTSNKPEYNKLFYETFHKIINDPSYKDKIGVYNPYTRTEYKISEEDFLNKLKKLYYFYVEQNYTDSANYLLKQVPKLRNYITK